MAAARLVAGMATIMTMVGGVGILCQRRMGLALGRGLLLARGGLFARVLLGRQGLLRLGLLLTLMLCQLLLPGRFRLAFHSLLTGRDLRLLLTGLEHPLLLLAFLLLG